MRSCLLDILYLMHAQWQINTTCNPNHNFITKGLKLLINNLNESVYGFIMTQGYGHLII